MLAFLVGGFFVSAHAASAGTLYFSPSSGTYAVGKTFTANVFVSTANQAANAYSGTLSYPSDLLELTSLGKGGSIVNLWVQEPSFSGGVANFEGVTFNPGYNGGAGKIISVTFKVKAAGTATVRFSSGAILANDGKGTNILSGLGSATYTLGAATETPEPEKPPVEVNGKPAAPKISSTTHPDPAKWYSVSDATFKWALQSGVDGVNLLADQIATTDPGTSSDGLFSSYTYQGVKDGTWYAHLRVRNKNGWSGVSHFQFNIDTQKPESFSVTELATTDPSLASRRFQFDAIDSGSGIDHYDIRIDDGAVESWKDDGSHVYQSAPVSAGSHTLHATAVDKAGNGLEDTATFSVQGLMAPRITEYPKTARSGDSLLIKGTTYPNSSVTLWIKIGDEQAYSAQLMSDAQGRFTYAPDGDLVEGTYQVWSTVTDSLGNMSEPGEHVTFKVKAPPFDIGAWVGDLIGKLDLCMVSNALLLLLLGLLSWRYYILTKRLGKEVRGAQEALHTAFDLLKDDIQQQITLLEKTSSKRELTMEEGRILKRLKRDLSVAEGALRKKIKKIGKDI